MINTNQLKAGLTLLVEGGIYSVVEYEHVKPGKGSAFVRTKLRNLKTQAILERTFKSGDKLEEAYIQQKKLLYLYRTGGSFHFMDEETYEQKEILKENLGDVFNFLKENTLVVVSYYKDDIVAVTAPTFVELKVEYTEQAVKGDTAKSTFKPATLETGFVIQAPLFINTGDIIRVDTRNGAYVARVG